MTSAVRSLIRKSISTVISEEISINYLNAEPHDMLAAIGALFAETNDAIHRKLESEAKHLRLMGGQTIAEYVHAHKNLRRRMYLESCLRIEEETTTVRFIFDGLGSHLNFKDDTRALRLSGMPGNFKTLQERLIDEEAAKLMATEFNVTPLKPLNADVGDAGADAMTTLRLKYRKSWENKCPKSLPNWRKTSPHPPSPAKPGIMLPQ